MYARNTPGSICQYKEDGLVSRPPSLFMSMCRPMHSTSCPKSQLKSTCLTAKFGSFLDHAETGEKGQNVISSSVQHPIYLIFAIHVSFIIPLPMMWILLYTCGSVLACMQTEEFEMHASTKIIVVTGFPFNYLR